MSDLISDKGTTYVSCGNPAHFNDFQAARSQENPVSNVRHRYDLAIVSEKLQMLAPIMAHGNKERTHELVDRIFDELESDEETDYLSDLLPLRVANYLDDFYGFRRLYQLQEISLCQLRLIPGIGTLTVKRIQKLMTENGMRLAQ